MNKDIFYVRSDFFVLNNKKIRCFSYKDKSQFSNVHWYLLFKENYHSRELNVFHRRSVENICLRRRIRQNKEYFISHYKRDMPTDSLLWM